MLPYAERMASLLHLRRGVLDLVENPQGTQCPSLRFAKRRRLIIAGDSGSGLFDQVGRGSDQYERHDALMVLRFQHVGGEFLQKGEWDADYLRYSVVSGEGAQKSFPLQRR
ncbi:hypothetical protein MRX96_055325 [Rhipicephalus microplus]